MDHSVYRIASPSTTMCRSLFDRVLRMITASAPSCGRRSAQLRQRIGDSRIGPSPAPWGGGMFAISLVPLPDRAPTHSWVRHAFLSLSLGVTQ